MICDICFLDHETKDCLAIYNFQPMSTLGAISQPNPVFINDNGYFITGGDYFIGSNLVVFVTGRETLPQVTRCSIKMLQFCHNIDFERYFGKHEDIYIGDYSRTSGEYLFRRIAHLSEIVNGERLLCTAYRYLCERYGVTYRNAFGNFDFDYRLEVQ